MDVTIRRATPDDARFVPPLIYSSGPAAFDFVFEHPTRGGAQGFLEYAFTRERGEFGYRNHTVADLDGEVIGVGAAWSGDAAWGEMSAIVMQIIRTYGSGAPGVIRRGLQLESALPPPKKDMQYIGHLGVAPDARSKGVGSQMIELFLEEGRRRGKSKAVLDVSVENHEAQRLYERLGFMVTEQIESSLSNGYATVPSHRRMSLDL